jgi:hypothetical protein
VATSQPYPRSSLFLLQARLPADFHGEEEPSSWFSFTIKEVDGKAELVQGKATGERPVIESLDGGMVGGMCIRVETEDETKDNLDHEIFDPEFSKKRKPMHRKTAKPDTISKTNTYDIDMTVIFSQIFASFYNIPPSILTFTLPTTLIHAEALITVGTTLSCLTNLPILTSTLNATLSQFRQHLFQDVRSDPTRWLLLSLSLTNDNIYTESLIHIAGAHPVWPWATKRSVLPEEIRSLVVKKSRELDVMC